jgi:hypothetical protein
MLYAQRALQVTTAVEWGHGGEAMDSTMVWGMVVLGALLLGLALASPLYWSRRSTARIEDPVSRANAERVEEEMWRLQRNHPDLGSPF